MLAERLERRFMATVVTNVIAKMRHRSVQVESNLLNKDHDVTRFLWIPKTSQKATVFHPAKLCRYQVLVGKEAQLENSSVSSCTALGLKGAIIIQLF